MRSIGQKDQKWERLCKGFALLNDRDQEYMLGLLEGLDFVNKKQQGVIPADTPSLSKKEVKAFKV
jgi:molybdopterin-guanine dinucleotide biosynthesis protein A